MYIRFISQSAIEISNWFSITFHNQSTNKQFVRIWNGFLYCLFNMNFLFFPLKIDSRSRKQHYVKKEWSILKTLSSEVKNNAERKSLVDSKKCHFIQKGLLSKNYQESENFSANFVTIFQLNPKQDWNKVYLYVQKSFKLIISIFFASNRIQIAKLL